MAISSTMQDVSLTVGSILRHCSGTHGERAVLTALGGGDVRRSTYAETGERAGRLAGALRRLGVEEGDRVAIFAWNNQEHLEAYLGVPAMGAVLHTLNIRLFPDQIVYIAKHADDRVVVVDGALVGAFAPLLERLPRVSAVLVTGDADLSALQGPGREVLRYDDALAGEPGPIGWPELDERRAAAMCYTSGTTGNPKGVVYSHRSIWLHGLAVCTGNVLGIRSDDVVLPIVPMFHASAWGLPYACAMAGAGILLPDRFMRAEDLVCLVERQRPTLAGAVPTIWRDILEYLRANPGHDISSFRMIVAGGSAVPRQLMEAYESEVGVQLIQAWGMTETSPVASVARPAASAAGEDAWKLRATQGRFICGVEGRLVDGEGNVLPNDGESVGELQVRGPWVTGAYYKDEDASRFEDGWLRTGDVGTMDERGFVTLTDRAKDVIKSGGEWISSVALEVAIAGHPAVLEAAVIAVPDERWQERPLAVVVLREGETATPEALRDWLGTQMPKWWLPERWCFVDAVPRTSVGKFDKLELRRRHGAGELEVLDAAPTPAAR